MPEIIVAFNRTTNSYYVNYAKLVYDISYADDNDSLRSTATVSMKFYIKPDSYTWSSYTDDNLSLGLRKGSSGAALTKLRLDKTLTEGNTVRSAVYNHVGSASFKVEYDSTKEYSIFLYAEYHNMATNRFAAFFMPKSDGSGFYDYRYISGGSNQVILKRRFNYTQCKAPTTLSFSPALFETVPNAAWSGAAAGVNNKISGYEIQLSGSADGKSFGTWGATEILPASAVKHTWTSERIRGRYYKFRIRAKGAAGSQWDSPWKESPVVRKNSLPLAPLSLDINKERYGKGDSLSLSWPGATDPDGNLKGYELEISVNGQGFVPYSTYSTTGTVLTPTQAGDGESIKYRVRSTDALGAKSAWRESRAVLRDDPTGIKLCIGGSYKKAQIYVCRSGSYKRAEIYVCRGGNYKPAVD